jgi:hypothetical protein
MDQGNFKFELGSSATITVSGESGTVIGRAQYTDNENAYYLFYQAGDGRATKQWWKETELQ